MVGSTDLNPEPPVFSGSTNKKGSSGSTKLILTSVGKEMPGATTAIRMTCTWRCSCMSGCTPPPSGAENPRPNQWRHPPARSLGDEMVSSVAALWRTQEEKLRRKNKCKKARKYVTKAGNVWQHEINKIATQLPYVTLTVATGGTFNLKIKIY